MTTEQVHLAQARHNTELAQLLAQDMVYKDWVITVSFYAGVHYLEAYFAKRFALHGDDYESPHIWRMDEMRRRHFSLICRNAYRRLYYASRNVCYLILPGAAGKTAADFYSEIEVRAFLSRDLEIVKHEMGY